MIYSFSQLPKAQREILAAWEWYEDKQIGLGDHFKDAIADKINLIVRNPLHYPLKGELREAQISGYPFLLIYKIFRDQIIIVSVFHTSRHPRKKR